MQLSKPDKMDDFQCDAIGVVGWFRSLRAAEGMAHDLKLLGQNVIGLSLDEPGIRLEENPKYSIQEDPDWELMVNRQKLVDLGEMIPEDDQQRMDYCILQQLSLQYDLRHWKNPHTMFVYWWHEATTPTWPIYDPDHPIPVIAGAYYAALAEINMTHPHAFYSAKMKTFMPHAVSLKYCQPGSRLEDRPLPLAFKGATNFNNGEFDTPLMKRMYNTRNAYLEYARNELRCLIENRTYSSQETYEFLEFLDRTQISLNIPAIIYENPNVSEYINDRPIFAGARRSLILTTDDPTWNSLGYHDNVNCLLVRSLAELKEKSQWALKHLDAAQTIANEGFKVSSELNSWFFRYGKFLPFIQDLRNRKGL